MPKYLFLIFLFIPFFGVAQIEFKVDSGILFDALEIVETGDELGIVSTSNDLSNFFYKLYLNLGLSYSLNDFDKVSVGLRYRTGYDELCFRKKFGSSCHGSSGDSYLGLNMQYGRVISLFDGHSLIPSIGFGMNRNISVIGEEIGTYVSNGHGTSKSSRMDSDGNIVESSELSHSDSGYLPRLINFHLPVGLNLKLAINSSISVGLKFAYEFSLHKSNYTKRIDYTSINFEEGVGTKIKKGQALIYSTDVMYFGIGFDYLLVKK